MKIAIITDIHHGSLSHTKDPNWDGLPALREFIDRAISEKADLVLDLGDHISDTTHEADHRAMSEVAEIFKAFPGLRVHVLGNHDVANLSIADNEAIFGQSMASSIIDLGDFRLIAWQPSVAATLRVGFPNAADHLDWLIEALNADDRPAVIATHVPLSGHSQIGNYYFQRTPHHSTYPDHTVVREAVEATGKAALWLSGHVHWNTVTNVGNVQHVTIQSLSERFTTAPLTAAAHAILEIEDGQFTVDVYGNDPFHVRLPFRKSGDRPWMAPMPPLDRIDPVLEAERLRA
ncbi:metallophosphoesterase [Rhizobium changzhiense]|uniref:metallophosphoesterase family protein n=1 Tax=Rhizobium changzhiense TaxID=2692317 RepID=UPI001F0C2BD8|nr:metallophosphoesterase [Rhizobium changzhiense]MCH4547457.1 metallophosphoesterase [Rhizobium changzhiense]